MRLLSPLKDAESPYSLVCHRVTAEITRERGEERFGDAETGRLFSARDCPVLLNRRVSCISWFLSRRRREPKLHQIAPCLSPAFYGTLANQGIGLRNCTMALPADPAGGFRFLFCFLKVHGYLTLPHDYPHGSELQKALILLRSHGFTGPGTPMHPLESKVAAEVASSAPS